MLIPVCFNETNDKELIEWLNNNKGTISRSAFIRLILDDYRLSKTDKSPLLNSKNVVKLNNVKLEEKQPISNGFANNFIKQIKK